MKKLHREIVAALLISTDNRILMVKKNPSHGGVFLDKWHIPGGGVEEGEEKIDALHREIYEEVGINVAQSTVEMIDDKGGATAEKKLKDGSIVSCVMKFWVYKVELPTSSTHVQVVLNDELSEYHWIGVWELDKFSLTPPSVELFGRIKVSNL